MLHRGLRLGIYVVKDAELVDFAAPHGVSVARRYDPELDVFLIADAMRPVQARAGFTMLPKRRTVSPATRGIERKGLTRGQPSPSRADGMPRIRARRGPRAPVGASAQRAIRRSERRG
jgi:hypothetical protein